MLRLHPRHVPTRRRVSLLTQPPARPRDSAEAKDRGRVLRLHQGHVQQRVRLTLLLPTPAISPDGWVSRFPVEASQPAGGVKKRERFLTIDHAFSRRVSTLFSLALPSSVDPHRPTVDADFRAIDTAGTRVASRTTRRRSRRSGNARRAARHLRRRRRSGFRSRRRGGRRARQAPPGGRARPLRRCPRRLSRRRNTPRESREQTETTRRRSTRPRRRPCRDDASLARTTRPNFRTSRSARERPRRQGRARARFGPSGARAISAAARSASCPLPHERSASGRPPLPWGVDGLPLSWGEARLGGGPRPSSGTPSGRGRRAAAPARRPCWVAAGRGGSAASARSARSAHSVRAREVGSADAPREAAREKDRARRGWRATPSRKQSQMRVSSRHDLILRAPTVDGSATSSRPLSRVGGEKPRRALAPSVPAQQRRAGCCLRRRTRFSSDADEGRARVRPKAASGRYRGKVCAVDLVPSGSVKPAAYRVVATGAKGPDDRCDARASTLVDARNDSASAVFVPARTRGDGD